MLLYTGGIMIEYMRDNKLREWLNQKVKEDELSHRELAKRLKMSHTKVSRFLSGQDLAGFDFCLAIARCYNRSPLLILSMGGLLPAYLGEKNESIDEVTQIMHEFDDSERHLILEVVRGFAQGIRKGQESDDTLDNRNDR
jgi:transcriptional regulator with XRE-family HTH domain